MNGDKGKKRFGDRDRERGRRGYDETPMIEAAPPKPEAPVPAFNAAAFEANKKYGYVWGTGRRKTAVARVRVRPGSGAFKVNGREYNEFFRVERDRRTIETPLEATETRKHLDVFVNVGGGGTTGQAGAIALGVARALKLANKEYEGVLRARGLLTRDPREVERKKYGRPGARRRFQFSKR
ncbi:MAG: hypothetical protein BroJett003_08830 [Planctomycetota bacterium]|nr:MAG: hypothetical protein BroJett003_08830 [Planctomycetota bacterium]